ncbi:disks large-associated protein 5-like [Rhincodon typus]|uniref:disks large-associated protein 5-like n=1 Tax=Rhincodon typus TaxID=259920 RepID=UPI00202FFEB7|nr:disks large-associated protein 5-like [Rhincodon typus]
MDLGQNRFSERYKAAAARGVEALRVKQARSRAHSQKENRDRQLRKSRRFDTLPLMALQEVEAEEPGPPKSSEAAVPSQMTRLEMLRRYKEEKILRKLKAEREKPKQIFKVGIYKPDVTPFQSQNIMKPKAPGVVPSTSDLRVTRSMAKKQELLLKKAPSVPKFAAPTKVGPVKGNVSNNRGSSTVVTGTRSQHQATSHQAAGPKVPIAREKKAPFSPEDEKLNKEASDNLKPGADSLAAFGCCHFQCSQSSSEKRRKDPSKKGILNFC